MRFELMPEELPLRDTLLVAAFMGFPDASMGASGAVRYLVESHRAAPLATWDGDDYYDFVELRPVSRVMAQRDRALIWPQGEFWLAREVPVSREPSREPRAGTFGVGNVRETRDAPEAGGSDTRSLLLFLAPEPRLRWRAYGQELLAFARRCGVTQAVFLGAALADVPHTRPPIVTGWATEPRLRTRLEAANVPFSPYQGPSSYQSAAIQVFREADIACLSLFSNGPHYLPLPNANLSLALLQRLVRVTGIELDLKALEEAGQALARQANSAMEDRSEFREYVHQLEAQFDAQGSPLAPGEMRRQAEARAEEDSGPLNVDPQDVVRGVEDFLRQRIQSAQEEGGAEPGSAEPGGPEPGGPEPERRDPDTEDQAGGENGGPKPGDK